MTVQECYERMGGDYESVFGRFRKEDRIKKFMFRFPADKSFETLCASYESGNMEEAFRAAHTLKGVSQNLSFDRLYKSSHEITEALRAENREEVEALLPRVREDYELTVSTIQALQAEEA